MDRIVIRPRIQVPLLVVLFVVWGLLGLNYFMSGDVVAERDWFGITLGVVLTAMGVVGVWRSLRLGVVVDSEGVRVRNLDRRDQFTPWHRVHAIECAQVDSRGGLPLYGPVIYLNEGSEAMPIRALGSYVRQDAQRKVERLQDLRAASAMPSPDDQQGSTEVQG